MMPGVTPERLPDFGPGEEGTGETLEPGPWRFALPEDQSQRDRLAELGAIAGSLVHELKNPIGSMRLNLEMLLTAARNGRLEPDKSLRRLERMSAGLDHLQDIAQAFLGFARPGRPDPDRVDVNGLLQELIDQQRAALTEAGIAVTFLPADHLRAVPADPSQLKSAFLNIVLNARDALLDRADGRKLIIATRNSRRGVRVLISNNGPPLSDQAAAHLFDPFYSTKENGTGLGLAIVRRLVDLHHGRVTASSDPDQGVSFTIEFPTTLDPVVPRTELPPPAVDARVRDGA